MIIWTDQNEDTSSIAGTFRMCYEMDMSDFDWQHTWASQYNENDR